MKNAFYFAMVIGICVLLAPVLLVTAAWQATWDSMNLSRVWGMLLKL